MKHPALIGSAFEDAGVPHPYGRVRTSRRTRVFLILTALWLINLFDVGLTMAAYHQGILYEMNPLGEWFLRLGPYSLILFKLAMVLMSTSILWHIRGHAVAELAAWTLMGAYVAVALEWHRCYEFYIAIGDIALLRSGPVHL